MDAGTDYEYRIDLGSVSDVLMGHSCYSAARRPVDVCSAENTTGPTDSVATGPDRRLSPGLGLVGWSFPALEHWGLVIVADRLGVGHPWAKLDLVELAVLLL